MSHVINEQLQIVDAEKRERFHQKLSMLRRRNKELGELQRVARVEKIGKNIGRARQITVLLRLMRRIKGMPLTYNTPELRCHNPKCSAVLRNSEVREIHMLPKDLWGMNRAALFTEEICKELNLNEFLA